MRGPWISPQATAGWPDPQPDNDSNHESDNNMNFLLHAIPGLSEHLRRQRDFRRLRELPDYLLDDIGLTRRQVFGPKRPRRF